jgi:hypothetical protein
MNGKLTLRGVHSGREFSPIEENNLIGLLIPWSGVLAHVTELLMGGR